MSKYKVEQKLVSFTDHPRELDRITTDISRGWAIINLIKNGNYFVGIMERNPNAGVTDTVYIPPRKKLKVSPHRL